MVTRIARFAQRAALLLGSSVVVSSVSESAVSSVRSADESSGSVESGHRIRVASAMLTAALLAFQGSGPGRQREVSASP